jgi:hypothetical protein
MTGVLVWCGVCCLQDPATPLSAQHYRGIYMLQEKVSRGRRRVNVARFNGTEDMSGGPVQPAFLMQQQRQRKQVLAPGQGSWLCLLTVLTVVAP